MLEFFNYSIACVGSQTGKAIKHDSENKEETAILEQKKGQFATHSLSPRRVGLVMV